MRKLLYILLVFLCTISRSYAETYRELRLFIDVDSTLVTRLGGTDKASIFVNNLAAELDALYRNELGLSVKLVGTHYWTSSDPFNRTDQNTLLATFAGYAEVNYYTQTQYDSAQLLVGDSLGGEGGVAYPSSACGDDPFLSHGVLQPEIVDEYEFNTDLIAHELGHNLGAEHDALPACAIKTVMCVAQIGNKFSESTRTQISNYVASRIAEGCFPEVEKSDASSDIRVKTSVKDSTVSYSVEGAEDCTTLSLVGSTSQQGLETIFAYLELGILSPKPNIKASSKKMPDFFGSKSTKIHVGAYCNGQLAGSVSSFSAAKIKASSGSTSIVTFLNFLKDKFKVLRSTNKSPT